MVERLRDGVAVPAVALGTDRVGAHDRPANRSAVPRQPRHQGGTEVKAEPLVVVADSHYRPIHRMGADVGGVAFAENPLVPVGKGSGAGLRRYQSGPRAFPRRLIKMTMDNNVAFL